MDGISTKMVSNIEQLYPTNMKLSISIEEPLVAFMARYQQQHARKSRSAVVEDALRLLVEREADAELAAAYAASAAQDRAMAQEASDTYGDGLAKPDLGGSGDEAW